MVVITTHPADSPGDESVRSLDRKSILIGGIIIVIISGCTESVYLVYCQLQVNS